MAQKESTCESKRDLVQGLLLSISALVMNCLKSLIETAISYIALEELGIILSQYYTIPSESLRNAEYTRKIIEHILKKRTFGS